MPGHHFCCDACAEHYEAWSRHPVRPAPPESEVTEYPRELTRRARPIVFRRSRSARPGQVDKR
ncbi:MAG: hypothetical protein R6X29_06920 [Acidimicrobiia bacterium]